MTDADEQRLTALAFEGALHDLGNCLNRIALEAALLQTKVAEEHHPSLAAIRAEVRSAVAAIRCAQPDRRNRGEPQSVSLAVAIRDQWRAAGVKLVADGEAERAAICADADDIALLLRVLAESAQPLGGTPPRLSRQSTDVKLTVVGGLAQNLDDRLGAGHASAVEILVKRTGGQLTYLVETERSVMTIVWRAAS